MTAAARQRLEALLRRVLAQVQDTASRPPAQPRGHNEQMRAPLRVTPGHRVTQAAQGVAQLVTGDMPVDHSPRRGPLLAGPLELRHDDLDIGATLAAAREPVGLHRSGGPWRHGRKTAGTWAEGVSGGMGTRSPGGLQHPCAGLGRRNGGPDGAGSRAGWAPGATIRAQAGPGRPPDQQQPASKPRAANATLGWT
jgi:hypothetical protein